MVSNPLISICITNNLVTTKKAQLPTALQNKQKGVDKHFSDPVSYTHLLLNKIKELSEGRSLKANIELLKHNATVSAQIAKAYLEILNSISEK